MVAPGVSGKPLRDGPEPIGGPSLTGRALLSLAFLLGFYVLALGTVALLVGGNIAYIGYTGRVQVQFLIITAVVGFAVLNGVFFINGSDGDDVTGVPVDERSQPELVALVRRVAREMGTEPPGHILLVPEVNAFVLQTGGLLGLRPGQRVMAIGLPLMEALTVDQLRGVVAHELGHYAGGDTRLGGLTYRAGASIGRTIENLGDTWLGRLFAAYGRRYMVISQRVRRRQELTADAAAVRLAGRENHMTALRRIEVTSYALDHFVRRYLAPLWQRGCDAENAFDGYRALLADPTRQEELASLEVAAQEHTTSRYDSHPALAERLAHAGLLPEGPTAGHDPRPARDLLADPDEVERQVGALLTRKLTGAQPERYVRWDGTAALEYATDLQDDGQVVLRAAATVAKDPDAATLAAAVVLVEEGQAEELWAAITGPLEDGTPEEQAELRHRVLTHYLGSAIGCYLVAERGHSWTVSWSGPLDLVDPKGKVKDPFAMAASLLDDPSSGGTLRRSLGGVTRLRQFRASSADTAHGEEQRETVLHVLPDVVSRRRQFDLLLSTSALVLHPFAGGFGPAMRRLAAHQGVHGPKAAAARRRLEALFARPQDEVLGRVPGALRLPLATLRNVRKRRGWVLEIDGAGDPKPWRIQCFSKESCEVLYQAIQELLVARVSPASDAA